MSGKLAVIGVGNMAGAILGGVLGSGLLKPGEITMYDKAPEKMQPFVARGCVAADSAADAAGSCKYVLLSVKPQVLEGVLLSIKGSVSKNAVLISICAGVSAAFIRTTLGFDCRVVTVMPNTPLLLGSGATAIGRVEPISDEEFAFVRSIFSSAGSAYEIPADRMNEVIPLNGSSPAYIYYFAKAFVEEAVENGFSQDTAVELFSAALVGSAKMMTESGKSLDELIAMVSSPGGTTLAGLDALKSGGFEENVKACSRATIKRAYELGK